MNRKRAVQLRAVTNLKKEFSFLRKETAIKTAARKMTPERTYSSENLAASEKMSKPAKWGLSVHK